MLCPCSISLKFAYSPRIKPVATTRRIAAIRGLEFMALLDARMIRAVIRLYRVSSTRYSIRGRVGDQPECSSMKLY